MANITTFLSPNAYTALEGKPVIAQKKIDFSLKNAAIADTVDVLRIPKGAVVTKVGLIVHTTQATVTIGVGDADTAAQYLAAQTLTDIKADADADEDGVFSLTATHKFYAAANTIRLVVAGAAAATAVVTVIAEYYQVAATAIVE